MGSLCNKMAAVGSEPAEMEELNESQRRKLVVQFYEKHESSGKAFAVRHFVEMGMSRSSVYHILRSFEERKTVERKAGSGKVPAKLPTTVRKRLVRAAADRNGVTQRKLASKFGVSQPYVCKVLQEEGLKHHKKEKAPHWTPELDIRQRRCCRKLSRDFCPPSSTVEIIVDDESYFPFENHSVPSNAGYYSADKENTPPEVRFSFRKKFEPKLLVWVALSSRGHSDLYFVPRRCSINGEVYRNECISGRLIPFIQEHHSDGDYLFWPDLASAHYANATQELLQEQNIPFVQKSDNPPSVPKLRPIEDFWGILKQAVYADGFSATTPRQLKQRIRKCVREVDWDVVQGMMSTIKTRLRQAADNGYLSLH